MFGYKHKFTGLKHLVFSFSILFSLLYSITSAGNPRLEFQKDGSPLHPGIEAVSNLNYGSQYDSIKLLSIPEVVITQSRHYFLRDDKKVSTPDSLIKSAFLNTDLGVLLSLFTPAYIHFSGSAGSLSTVFIRGMNSSQTSVNWNGFQINSLTLGVMDFSSIPVRSAQDISVVHGASGSIAGSGNFGGTVLLENRADWTNRFQAGIQSELGTYDNRHFSFEGKAGSEWIQYQLQVFSHQAENNFVYRDLYKSGNPLNRADNNSLNNKGLIQNIFIRLPGNNLVETGIWYQVKQKQIPSLMGSFLPAKASQLDSTLRVYGSWQKIWDRSSITLRSALFDEYMFYNDGNILSDNKNPMRSEIQTGRFMTDLNYRIRLIDFLSVEGGVSLSNLSSKVGNYGEKTDENRSAFVTAAKLILPGLSINTSLRKEFHSHTGIPFLFAFGARKSLPVKGMEVKFSYADQFRVPTFNDKYWRPGGNPNLRPESGYTVDAGIIQELRKGKRNALGIEINAYRSLLHDMIQWTPSIGGNYWLAANRKEVRATGVEVSVNSFAYLGEHRLDIRASYNHGSSRITGSYDEEESVLGKRLIYVPSNAGSATALYSFKRIDAAITGSFTGSRYTDEFNNRLFMMPGIVVFNSYAGYRIKAGDVSGRIQIRIMNIFNSHYQVLRSYPMEGRTIHLSFALDFRQSR